LATETAFLPEFSKKSDQSDYLNVTTSTQAISSPATSPLNLSTSMEQENPDDTYILLDECVSGPASASSKMSSSLTSTPSPESTLGGTNAPVDYMNLDISPDDKVLQSAHPPHSSFQASSSLDGVFEAAAQSESGSSIGVDMPGGYFTAASTNREYMGIKISGENHFPPALPAKITVAPSVEYDVPVSSSVRVPTSHHVTPGPVPVVAPPPRPHMAVQGRMHRYVNTAPTVVTHTRTPVSQNYAESSSTVPIGGYHQAAPRSTASIPLPPKSHG